MLEKIYARDSWKLGKRLKTTEGKQRNVARCWLPVLQGNWNLALNMLLKGLCRAAGKEVACLELLDRYGSEGGEEGVAPAGGFGKSRKVVHISKGAGGVGFALNRVRPGSTGTGARGPRPNPVAFPNIYIMLCGSASSTHHPRDHAELPNGLEFANWRCLRRDTPARRESICRSCPAREQVQVSRPSRLLSRRGGGGVRLCPVGA
jgi:hypothetical protein